MESVQNIVEAIKKLSAVQLVELVEELKTVFGIDESMLVVSSGGGAGAAASEAGEQGGASKFNVIMNNVAMDKKTDAIKKIKELLGIGLGDAKGMVDKAMTGEEVVVKGSLSKAEADELCGALAPCGASVSAVAC